MKTLVLRFDSHMMSFGTVNIGPVIKIGKFPNASMLCGLVANSLGFYHEDFSKLQELQSRIRYAARWDSWVPTAISNPNHYHTLKNLPAKAQPYRLNEMQTTDFGQEKMTIGGWTTWKKKREERGKSSQKTTHQSYHQYWADAIVTVVVSVQGEGFPNLENIKESLQYPARPLFLGKKCCIPARPILDRTPIWEGENELEIIKKVPIWNRDGTVASADNGKGSVNTIKRATCWPADIRVPETNYQVKHEKENRDWANRIFTGHNLRAEGIIQYPLPMDKNETWDIMQSIFF